MPDWVRVIIAIAIMTALIGLFILSYVLNKRTPAPKGCRELSEECKVCGITSCSRHPGNTETDKAKEENDMEEGKK